MHVCVWRVISTAAVQTRLATCLAYVTMDFETFIQTPSCVSSTATPANSLVGAGSVLRGRTA